MKELEYYLKYEQPNKYIVKSDQYCDDYSTPVLTAGQTFILGYTNEEDNIFPASKENPVIIFDDFTTSVQFVDFNFKVKSSAMKILISNRDINIKYFYYLIKNIKKENSLHKRYWISDYAKKKIKEISIEEQNEVVRKLDLLYDAINNKNKQNEELLKLIDAKFLELFGDININEKEMVIKSLCDVSKISSSKRIYLKEYVEKGIPFYRSKEIVELGNGKQPSTRLFISEERYNEVKTKYGVPKIGDILITAVGTIGKMWLIDNDKPFYYKDGNLILISLSDELTPIYFKYALNKLMTNFKKTNVTGGVYAALTIEKFKKMSIIVPRKEIQAEFECKYNYLMKMIYTNNEIIKKLNILLIIKISEYLN